MQPKTLNIIGLTAIIIAFAHIGQLGMAGREYIIEAGQSSFFPQWIAQAFLAVVLLVLIFLIYKTIKIYFSFKGGAKADKVILMTAMIVSFSLFGILMIQMRSFSLEYKYIDPGLTDIILRIILELLFLIVIILGYKTIRTYLELKN